MSEINLMDTEEVMQHWDRWRTYIASGGGGSWPSDAFESFISWYIERIKELEQELAKLKQIKAKRSWLIGDLSREGKRVVDDQHYSIGKMNEANAKLAELWETLREALHYCECYLMHWPLSGVGDVVEKLKQALAKTTSPQSPQ